MTLIRKLPTSVIILLMFCCAPVLAQSKGMPLPEQHPRPSSGSVVDMRRRLVELDRLLTLKSVGRAESLLAELSQHSALQRELISRRIRLAQLRQDHKKAVEICRQALNGQPNNAGFWRSLTTSLLAVDHPDSARMAADGFISTSPNKRSAGMVTVELFKEAHRPVIANDLIDSMRTVLDDKLFMGRQKAVVLLEMQEYELSADAMVADLRSNPFNLGLVRTEILEGGYLPGKMPDFLKQLTHRATESEANSSEIILAANLYLMEGNTFDASQRAHSLFGKRSGMLAVLQNSVTLQREMSHLEITENNPEELQSTIDYLLDVLAWLISDSNYDQGIRRRAADNLAAVCEIALEKDVLGENPQEAADRFDELLRQVLKVNPQSKHLYSSQLKLAAFTRDELQQPAIAARGLESLLLDMDLPLPGVALVRLSLGECYLAAGDTTRGRIVLTRLGRDPDFRKAGGHAHYHLARLDLAQGNLVTARDRFAVVAMDNPAAPYANDALELGLAITEEMDNASGGPEMLLLYSQAVYFDLVVKPQERMQALEDFIKEGIRRLDMEEPQHLMERARFELANLYAKQGRLQEAVELFQTISREHPRGRFPANSLMRKSELEKELGQDQDARSTLELLLAQYPDYLFIDDARDAVRSLP